MKEFANFSQVGKKKSMMCRWLVMDSLLGKPGSPLGGILTCSIVLSPTHVVGISNLKQTVRCHIAHLQDGLCREMVLALHSAHYCRRLQDHYSLQCLSKGCFPAHLSSPLLKRLHPITVTSTISPFSQFFCTCICFFLFLSAI